MSEATVRSFPSRSCSEHFRKYLWKSPYVSNDCLWKLCFYLDFLADFLVDIYEIFNKNNSSNPGSQGPEFPDPGVLVPLLHHASIQFVFIVCQVGNYQNILKLNRKPPALTSHKTFRKTKRGLELASLPHFLHDF